MKRIISNKYLDVTDDEFSYYKNSLETALGPNPLAGMFTADEDGLVIDIIMEPSKPFALIALFFLLNIKHNQVLRKFASKMKRLDELEKRLEDLEEKINEKSS